MKILVLLSSLLLLLFTSSCEENECFFEVGTDGVLEKVVDETHTGGMYYIGDLSNEYTFYEFVNNDSSIDLDDYLGEDVTILGNYIRERQGLNDHTIIEVISVEDR